MAIALGHGLELSYMKLYERTSSSTWKKAGLLQKDKKYKLSLKFKNTNSSAYMPPITERHSHLELYAVEISNTSYAMFYSSSAYTGPSSKIRSAPGTHKISAGKSKFIRFYFIWESPTDVPLPPPGFRIYVKLTSAVFKSDCDKTMPPFG